VNGLLSAGRILGLGGLAGFPFGDHAVELLGGLLDLADGRADPRREQRVLGRVFGEGCDQQVEDRGDRLGQGGGGCPFHS
jgi:hypothetical protein